MLQLSGHTHGGQCQVSFTGYPPVEVQYGRKYVYGGFSQGDSSLFVTRGVGTTGLRVRFACPPELAVLILRSAEIGWRKSKVYMSQVLRYWHRRNPRLGTVVSPYRFIKSQCATSTLWPLVWPILASSSTNQG